MIYAVGVAGFIGGFIFGQMLLFYMLRHKTNEEIMRERHIKLKYGAINWLCAILGAYGLIKMYEFYFPV